jgi:outer membrane protein TolC
MRFTQLHVLVLVLMVQAAAAQNLTRQQALAAAQRSASVIAAQARVSAAEAQVVAAGLPLSGALTGGYAFSGSDVDATRGGVQAGITIRFAGLYGDAAEDKVRATLALERARRAALSARLRSSKTALSLWHGLRLAQAQIETAQLNRAASEIADAAAEARLQSGAINASERERVRTSLETDRLDELRAESRLALARVQLEATLGLRAESSAGPWTPLPTPQGDGELDSREDVFEARAVLTGAELDLEKARRAILPVGTFDASLTGATGSLQGRLDTALAASVTYAYPNALASPGTGWSVGISVNLPLDPAKLSAFTALEASVQAARASLDAARAAARADIRTKRAALQLAARSLELAGKRVETERANLERSRARSASGLSTALEVKRAEAEAARAVDALATAQAESDAATVELFEALALPMT